MTTVTTTEAVIIIHDCGKEKMVLRIEIIVMMMMMM